MTQRTYKQIIQSKEDDSFQKTNTDNAVSGTSSVSVDPVNANKRVYVTDINVNCTQSSILSVLNGTAFMFRTELPANPNPGFIRHFQTPLKCSEGTTCTAKVEDVNSTLTGTTNINLGGYIST